MSSTLLSNASSTGQGLTNALTNRPNRVRVIVEDEADLIVWKRLLCKYAPGITFDITIFSTFSSTPGKGKSPIIKMAESGQLGPNCIGCVDSDFDWLLKQWTKDGAIINSTQYLFQTYAYAIENLALQPYEVEDCLLECVLHTDDLTHSVNDDYKNFLFNISSLVYDVLLWHLTMLKMRVNEAVVSDGRKEIFNNYYYNHIKTDRRLSVIEKHEATLRLFAQRVNNLISRYERNYGYLKSNRHRLENLLRSDYGFTRNNAYLYVQGHSIFDFIKANFLEGIYADVKLKHEKHIDANTQGYPTLKNSENCNAREHYKKCVKDFPIKFLHRSSYLMDETNPIIRNIRKDITAAFK